MRDFLKILPGRIDEYETLLNANRIWLSRTVGIGVLPAEEAINFSLTGPALRGSGVKYDLRKAQPYSAYSDFEFEIPVGENGDTYDRYLVPHGRDETICFTSSSRRSMDCPKAQ